MPQNKLSAHQISVEIFLDNYRVILKKMLFQRTQYPIATSTLKRT